LSNIYTVTASRKVLYDGMVVDNIVLPSSIQ
jgi:hypothetical protein